MSIRTADAGAGAPAGPRSNRAVRSARDYFLSDSRRAIQTVLGLVWLLDGALQFQSFMYSHGFIDMLTQMVPGQPSWLGSSMRWASRIAAGNLDLYNTLFALTQVLIGLGLLYRRTVKPALAVSFVWALVVWWFGEAFGMLFMNMANPLTGAPGAVLLYGIVGLVVWPNDRPGGLLGVRGARTVWAVLWVLMGGLWLLGVNSTANATTTLINAAPSGMSWLTTVQDWTANAAQGNGLIIAVVLAFASLCDRDRRCSQLACARVPDRGDRSQSRLLGARPGVRRDLQRGRDRPERGALVRAARVGAVRVAPDRRSRARSASGRCANASPAVSPCRNRRLDRARSVVRARRLTPHT